MTRTDTTNWTAEDLRNLVRELEDQLEEAQDRAEEAEAEARDAWARAAARAEECDELILEREEATTLWVDEATEVEEALGRGDDPATVWRYFWFRTQAAQ